MSFINCIVRVIFRLDKSAGLILKLFGPKFHPDFPNERRGATGGCPPGIWATTTDDHYKTLGVDLKLEAGKPVSTFLKRVSILSSPFEPICSALSYSSKLW